MIPGRAKPRRRTRRKTLNMPLAGRLLRQVSMPLSPAFLRRMACWPLRRDVVAPALAVLLMTLLAAACPCPAQAGRRCHVTGANVEGQGCHGCAGEQGCDDHQGTTGEHLCCAAAGERATRSEILPLPQGSGAVAPAPAPPTVWHRGAFSASFSAAPRAVVDGPPVYLRNRSLLL